MRLHGTVVINRMSGVFPCMYCMFADKKGLLQGFLFAEFLS